MKKFLCTVLVILLVFALSAAGGYGYAWYRCNHVFVAGVDATQLMYLSAVSGYSAQSVLLKNRS